MALRALAYVRVSTREQDEEVQRRAVEEFSRSRGIQVIGWYVDKGESGAKPFSQRPGAQRLLRDVEEAKPEAVVVWSIDRLGRSMIDTLNTVIALEEKNVKVVSVKEDWLQTLDDNIRRLVLSILSWVAEWERKRIRERQLEAWAQGKQKGRPRKLKPEAVEKYLKRYGNLKLKAIWKIMRQDGLSVSYETLRRRVKELGFVYASGAWRKLSARIGGQGSWHSMDERE